MEDEKSVEKAKMSEYLTEAYNAPLEEQEKGFLDKLVEFIRGLRSSSKSKLEKTIPPQS